MSKEMSKTSDEPCWCGHRKRWHNLAGVCRWCAKMELRHPNFNFMPRHAFATEVPEELRHQAAEAADRLLRESQEQDDVEGYSAR